MSDIHAGTDDWDEFYKTKKITGFNRIIGQGFSLSFLDPSGVYKNIL